MTSETFVLTLATLLGFGHLFCVSVIQTAAHGSEWNTGPRDQETPPLKGKPARLQRAFENFKETFPFFAAAVFLVITTNKMGTFSQAGVYIYFIARIVYIPLYLFAVRGIRSLCWLVSVMGIFLILAQIFI
ncbi:MAG: MAPEG family protein [Bdellovibrionaceae bacterium]|nr:MAPEG family protein [Pseudobdellovibrionaceae bacterium]